jgi:hypothetical protein
MRRSLVLCVASVCAIAACLTATQRTFAQVRPDPSVKAVLAATERYLAAYQKQLTFLLADEASQQQVFEVRGGVPRLTDERRLTGEMFVTFLAADRAWISVHDPTEVDGRPIEDREDIRHLLERDPPSGAARFLVNHNARFNIGSITRNFNEPTLALLALEPRRRDQFKFSRARTARDGDVDLVTLAFKETDRPTLVQGVNGGDLFSTGEITVETGSGRVREAMIRFTYGPVVAQLTTIYAHDPNVDVWVPTTFTERYERTGRVGELIVCDTTFSNYRKFDVKVTIK